MVKVSSSTGEFPLAQEMISAEAFAFTTGIFEEVDEKGQVIMTIVGVDKDSGETRAFTCFFDHMLALATATKMIRSASAIPLPRR